MDYNQVFTSHFQCTGNMEKGTCFNFQQGNNRPRLDYGTFVGQQVNDI